MLSRELLIIEIFIYTKKICSKKKKQKAKRKKKELEIKINLNNDKKHLSFSNISKKKQSYSIRFILKE